MPFDNKKTILLICVIITTSLIIVMYDWHLNHTIEGACDQLRIRGFTVERALWNQTMNFSISYTQIRYFADFEYYAKSFYSVSFNDYKKCVVYWEPHFYGDQLFYSLWFNYKGKYFVYQFYPETGTN